MSEDVAFANIGDETFCEVPVGKWLKRGQEYKFRLSVDSQYDNIFYGIYTKEEAQHETGSLRLCMGDVLVDGQSLVRYTYEYPLNFRNVVCLWGMILTLGFSACNMLGEDKGKREKKGKLWGIWDNLWRLAERYQIWILLAEMFVILAMTVFICRNRTVDWDEAYSIQMITKYSFWEMFRITAEDIHPPLYYILLRLFGMIFGTSVFALKLMSVLFIGLTMLLGVTKIRKNWGWCAAFWFNLVVGLGPQFIFYSVNIRMYSLSLFFVMWCALLAYDIINGIGKKNWILFVLSALGGAYTHYFTVVPLAFICGYLLVGLFLERKKECKYFVGVCVGIVLGYLPWLFVAISSFQRSGVTGGVDAGSMDFADLTKWAFATNIKFSEITPLILFGGAVILLVIEWKRFVMKDRLFLLMCALNLLFSYVMCRLISSMTARFWHNRYVFAAMGTFWLFMAIIYSRRGRAVICFMTAWLSVTVLSAFVIHKAAELGTNTYMDATYEVLEQVRQEEIILYNYHTYHVLYSSHLREQEFIYIDDIVWEELEQDYIYCIAWGGHWFDDAIIEKYNLQVIDCGTMRFEEGVAKVKLYKILIS